MLNNEFKHSGYLLLIKMTIVDLVGRECVGKSIKVIWSTSYASLSTNLSNYQYYKHFQDKSLCKA